MSPYFHFSRRALCPPFRNTTIFDLSTFTKRLKRFAVSKRTFNWFCRPHILLETKITSSANRRMKISIKSGISCIPCLYRCIISLANSLIKRENKTGLLICPCLRPLGHINDSVKSFPARTLLLTTLYMFTF